MGDNTYGAARDSAQGYRRIRSLTIALCGTVIVAIWILLALQLRYEQKAGIETSLAVTTALAKAFEEHVVSTINTADLVLRDIDEEYSEQGRNLDLAAFARERKSSLAPFSVLSVIDEQGNLLKRSTAPVLSRVNFSDTDNFRFHAGSKSDELYVGKARKGVSTSKWTIYISRRINKANGAFGGEANVGIDVAYLSGFYERVSLGTDSVVTLLGRDGYIRARHSSQGGSAGENVRESPLFAVLGSSGESGTFVTDGILDGRARLFSYRALRDHPLIVAVGQSKTAALAAYREHRATYVGWASSITLVLVLFGTLLARQIGLQGTTTELLRQREQRLKEAQTIAGLGSWELDVTANRLTVSDEIVTLLETDPGRLGLSYSYADLVAAIHPDDRERVDRAYAYSLVNKAPYEIEYRLQMPDGRVKFVRERCHTDFDGAGEPMRSVGTVQDVTGRRQAEESAARLAAIVQNSTDAIISRSLEGTILTWNAGAERLFGYSESEAVGQPIDLILPPDQSDKTRKNSDILLAGGQIPIMDVVRRTKDGRIIDVMRSMSPVRDETGQVTGIAIVMRDITERKRAEQEIRRLNVDLEQRVAERTAELEKTVQQLEVAAKEMESFTYSVAHDLRAPLRAMHAFSTILVDDYGTEIPEEGRGYLARVAHNAQRMGHLIDDLLDFSRYGREPMKQQQVDVGALVSDIVAEQLAAGSRAEVRIGDLPPCRADAALLRQVWVNLISNALKYSESVASPLVEVGHAGGAYFVRDNGVGFDMAHASKLFGVFNRLHRIEEFEGTGVGLAIVKRIVERHGGRVWAQAEVGKGAAFFFMLA
jgi:PAS domain S-box-containing protein